MRRRQAPRCPACPPTDQTFPKFAEQQPGFIPDAQTPSELLNPAPPADLGFSTQLGPAKLSAMDTESLIANQAGSPSLDLPNNFARVVVPTGSIEGSTETKQFHIEGGLIIYYSEVTITGDSADIDEKSEIAILKGNVTITDPKYTLTTDELRIQFADKRFEATGFVQFKKNADPSQEQTPIMSRSKKDRVREYFAGQQFELYCSKLFYNWETKEMTALIRRAHGAPLVQRHHGASGLQRRDQAVRHVRQGGARDHQTTTGCLRPRWLTRRTRRRCAR